MILPTAGKDSRHIAARGLLARVSIKETRPERHLQGHVRLRWCFVQVYHRVHIAIHYWRVVQLLFFIVEFDPVRL